MRSTNIRKNEDFKGNITSIGTFFKKTLNINSDFFHHFLIRPARPCFQSHAAHNTL